MVSQEQAVEIARRVLRPKVGDGLLLLDVREIAGNIIGKTHGSKYWMVSFQLEPGLDPAILVSVDVTTGEAIQEKVL